MPGYVMAFLKIDDPDVFDNEYIPALQPTLDLYGGAVLLATDEVETLEGETRLGRLVVFEFPGGTANARAWYESAGYRPLRDLRQKITTSVVLLMPGGFTLHLTPHQEPSEEETETEE